MLCWQPWPCHQLPSWLQAHPCRPRSFGKRFDPSSPLSTLEENGTSSSRFGRNLNHWTNDSSIEMSSLRKQNRCWSMFKWQDLPLPHVQRSDCLSFDVPKGLNRLSEMGLLTPRQGCHPKYCYLSIGLFACGLLLRQKIATIRWWSLTIAQKLSFL